jgi:phage terminase large subunit-like protein
MATKKDYVAIARQYAASVVDETIPACRWVKLACARAIRDFESQGQPDFPFYFSDTHANRVCAFMELLRHVQGPKADERLVLEPWQCFLLCQIFGWLRNGTQVRRYRRAYICLPRGNGKSLLASGVSIYCAFAEGEKGADVIATACSLEQSRVVLDTAREMLLKDQKLAERLGVEILANHVESKTFSKLRIMPNKSSALQGTAVHCAVLDELHANTKSGRATYSALSTATAKREQSLLLVITTSGMDTAGVCYELDSFVRLLLEGEAGASDNSFFGIIYTVNEEMEATWDTEEAWRIANPNYGVSVNTSVLLEEANRARHMPAQQAEFKNKYLCIWVASGGVEAFLDQSDIRKCYDGKLSEADFAGQSAVLGCDLASRLDMCSVVRVHARRDAKGDTHYYAFCKNWLPQATIEKSKNASYRGWIIQGHLVQTEGVLTKISVIENYLLEQIANYKIRDLNYDPLQANYLVERLKQATERHRHHMYIEAQQYAKFLTSGMQCLEEVCAANRLHTNSPVLLWALGNLCAKRVGSGLLYPTKSNNRELKIDPAVALVMALRSAATCPLDQSKRVPRILIFEY